MPENPKDDKGQPELPPDLRYIQYEHAFEKQYLPSIRALISKDLSEPYSIYVYRYFLYQWGDLCFMVMTPIPSAPIR
jgi:peptide alpha-N-acetyltransferase